MGGAGGLEPPLTSETGREGLSPLILPHAHTITILRYNSKCLYFSAQGTISAPKWLLNCFRNALGKSNYPKFSREACPQTPLSGLWANSKIVVTIHNQRSEPPPPPHTFTTCSLPL